MNLTIHVSSGEFGDYKVFYDYKGSLNEKAAAIDYLRRTLELIDNFDKPKGDPYELASELAGIFKTIADFLKKYEKK